MQSQNQLLQEEISNRISIEKALEQQNQLLQNENEINNRLSIESYLKEQNQLLKQQIKDYKESNYLLKISPQGGSTENFNLLSLEFLENMESMQNMVKIIEGSISCLGTTLQSAENEISNLAAEITQNSQKLQEMIERLTEVLKLYEK